MKKIILMSFIGLMLTLQGCSDDGISPEDEVRQFIENGIQAAENRNSGDLSDMLFDFYTDQNGYDKKKLVNLLRAYFFRHKNIHLFSRIRDVRMLTDREAEVVMHVAMAGQVISDVTALASLRADLYRFELDLVKEGDDWLLRSAKWKRAQMNDMN
ncbi:MAG: hypothetical protein QNJ69_10515 [Gammaproteobacteria bacterium]|nr:hypothetical protein [Gammaproteobacteria bacterium]